MHPPFLPAWCPSPLLLRYFGTLLPPQSVPSIFWEDGAVAVAATVVVSGVAVAGVRLGLDGGWVTATVVGLVAVVALHFSLALLYFVAFSDDVEKPSWKGVGAAMLVLLLAGWWGRALLSLLLLISALALAASVWVDDDRRVLVLQVWEFLRGVPMQTQLNLYRWFLSHRGWTHLYDQIFHRHHPDRPSPSTPSEASTIPYTHWRPSLLCHLPQPQHGDGCDNKEEEEELMVHPSFEYADHVQDVCLRHVRPGRWDPFHVIARDLVGPVVYVEDSGTGLGHVYGLTEEEEEEVARCKGAAPVTAWVKVVERLSPGEHRTVRDLKTLHHLTSPQIRALRRARILVGPDQPRQRNAQWEASIRQAQIHLQHDGWTILPDLLPPIQLEALRDYCRRRRQAGDTDDSSNGYLYKWHDQVATMFNCSLTRLVERITQEELLPTKSLVLYYGGGSFLDVHLDWHPFAYALSLTVDLECDTATAGAWPLTFISKKNTPHLVDLSLHHGVGVLFKGHELPHYRDRLKPGCSVISISFSWDRKNRLRRPSEAAQE